MCGRFVGTFDGARLIAELGEQFPLDANMNCSLECYNVAPTMLIPVLHNDGDLVRCSPMRWGFTPTWTRHATGGSPLINARIETVEEKASFRHLVQRTRCVVPMDGFYEWARTGSSKTPHYVHRPDEKLMLVAGLWRESDSAGGHCSVVMLTEESVQPLSAVHHRAPVQLSTDDAHSWLSEGEISVSHIQMRQRPDLVLHPVSTRVNRVTHNDATLIDPVVESGDGTDEGPHGQLRLF